MTIFEKKRRTRARARKRARILIARVVQSCWLSSEDINVRYLYSGLFYLLLPFIFLRLLWRSRKASGYRQRWAERLGFVKKLDNCIWVHCVSLGETIAAVPLIERLRVAYPQHPILVTNMTLTGSTRVQQVFGSKVINTYIPYDLPDAMQRFVKRVNPLIAVVMETELWPNLFAACKANSIPIVVTNARLSEKSFRKYLRIPSLVKEMLNTVTIVSVQNTVDAGRFERLGIAPNKLVVTGNIKFDLAMPNDLAVKAEILTSQLGADRLCWVAASTHAQEEEIILAAHKIIRAACPSALLLLVPRHPERFPVVAKIIQQQQLTVVKRSEQKSCTESDDVYLVDTMGEMMLMYAVSEVAFVGGSFVPVGGHNMLEPAALTKPVLTGPHLFNFAEVKELLLAQQGLRIVHSGEELAQAVIQLFLTEKLRTEMGEKAYAVIAANRGALERQFVVIAKCLMP